MLATTIILRICQHQLEKRSTFYLVAGSSHHLLQQIKSPFNCDQKCSIHSLFGRKKRKNYYEILGVGRYANKKQIKKSYIKLAKLYHPDSASENTKSHEKFQEVLEAYQTLSDDSKRKVYDTEVMKDMGTKFTEKEQTLDINKMKHTVDAEALFRNIFGDVQENPYAKNEMPREERYAETRWGRDYTEALILPVTLEEAANGVTKNMELKTVDLCYMCNGTRSALGYRSALCPFCDENGMETISTEPIICKIKCRACGGSREYIKYMCPDCEGKGYQVQSKVASFSIPPGVQDEEKLKLVIRNQIIYLTIRLKKDDYFTKIGNEIHTTNEISISQALLGGCTTIKGLFKQLDVKIPSGTESHSTIRLKNHGWPMEDHSFGDHVVHFKIKVPEKLSRKQRKIWQEFAEIEEKLNGTVDGIVETTQGKKFINAEENVSLFTRLKRALLG